MKKFNNNQKALIGSLILVFSWIILPELFDFFWGGMLILIFLFTLLGGYLIWPMAKDIDNFNNKHNNNKF